MNLNHSRPPVYVLLIAFLMLGFTPPPSTGTSAPQNSDTTPIEFTGSIGGPVRAVAAVGDTIYLGEGSVLSILNVRDLRHPVRQGQAALPGFAYKIQVVNQIAYVLYGSEFCFGPVQCAESSGLQVLDVRNPARPIPTGNYAGTIRVATAGGYAYLLSSAGLQVLDVQNPLVPVLRGSYSLPNALDIQLKGQFAYIAAEPGVSIVDISNPDAIELFNAFSTAEPVVELQVAGNMLYELAEQFYGTRLLEIIDISSPSHPVLRGIQSAQAASSLQVVGTNAYAVNEKSLLRFDVSNADLIPPSASYTTTADISDVQISGRFAYIAAQNNGILVVDISRQSDLTLSGSFPTTSAWDIQVAGETAYVADGAGGTLLVDITDSANLRLRSKYTSLKAASNVSIAGDLAYLSGPDSLQLVDVRNPKYPTLRGVYNAPAAENLRVQLVGSLAFATYQSLKNGSPQVGLRIIDVHDPVHPALLSGYDAPGESIVVREAGDWAYIAAGVHGIQIVDLRNPLAPTLRGTYTTFGSVFDIQVSGAYAYAGTRMNEGFGAFQIFTLQNPANPVFQGSYNVTGFGTFGNMAIAGDYAYLASYVPYYNVPGYLEIIDLSNPSTPTLRSTSSLPNRIQNLQISDRYLSMAYTIGSSPTYAFQDFLVLDISDPAAPLPLGSYAAPWPLRFISQSHVVGNLAYLDLVGFSGPSEIDIISLNDPAVFTVQRRYTLPAAATGFDTAGDYLYLVGGSLGLRILQAHANLWSVSAIVTPIGGQLETYDGGLRLQFPPGAVSETTTISYTGYLAPSHELAIGRAAVRAFSLEARTSTGRLVSQFQKPYTIVIKYTGAQLATHGVLESSLRVDQWNGQSWIGLLPCVGCGNDAPRSIIVESQAPAEFVLSGDQDSIFLPRISGGSHTDFAVMGVWKGLRPLQISPAKPLSRQ
jgi:hypothetical protein